MTKPKADSTASHAPSVKEKAEPAEKKTQPSVPPASVSQEDVKKALKRGHGLPPREIVKGWFKVLGVPGIVLLVVCFVHLVLPKRWGIRGVPGATALFILAMLFLLLSAIRIGTVQDRHFLPAIPVLAAWTGIALTDLLGAAHRFRRVAQFGLCLIVLIVSFIAVAGELNYRDLSQYKPERARAVATRWRNLGQNADEELIAAAEAIGRHAVKENKSGVVHSLFTSATWYYSGLPTTWGSVNVPILNHAMFRQRLFKAFYSFLPKGICYLLVTNTAIDLSGSPVPMGYTPAFFANVTDLLRAGVMRIVYPQELADAQAALLQHGRFDLLLVRDPSGQFAVLDVYEGAIVRSPPDEVIWGNPGLRFIGIEFDIDHFKEKFWPRPQRTEPVEKPAEEPVQ